MLYFTLLFHEDLDHVFHFAFNALLVIDGVVEEGNQENQLYFDIYFDDIPYG